MKTERLTPEEAYEIECRLLREMAQRYVGGPNRRKKKEEKIMTKETIESMSVDTLVKVKQLPIIEEQLRALKEIIEARTSEAMALVCNDDTLQSVKAVRADLNREFAALEDRRKAVKKQIMEPYDRFEAVYKECVTDAFSRADRDLKDKIDTVECEIKRACEDELRSYFAELCLANKLDWLEYERAGVKVDMSSARSKTPKKLMEQIKLFVDGVAQSVATISTLDDAAEVMAEYKQSLDMGAAIATVQQRKKAVELARAEAEARNAAMNDAVVGVTEPPAAYSAPKAVKAAEVEKLTVSFTVTDTRERLKLLKAFLVNNGYQFK